MNYKDLLKNKKLIFVIFITFFFILSYYLDSWTTTNMSNSRNVDTSTDSDTVFGLNGMTSKTSKNGDSFAFLAYSDIEKEKGSPNLNNFHNASFCMKLYFILLIVCLYLLFSDENKYKLYIEGIFAFLGILGAFIYTFITSATNTFINSTKQDIKYKLGSSSYLLLLSSIGCLSFAGLLYTQKI